MALPVAADALRFAAPLAALAGLAAFALAWWAALPFLIALAFVLWFFRDPERTPPRDHRALVAPADGKVVEIDPHWPGSELVPPGARLGIFLSVFDVHVNRTPAPGEVLSVHYQPGRFLNALRARSAEVNESNLIRIRVGAHLLGVKQIAGTIARRIVCTCRPGDRLEHGQRLGLIRFGSRTELYLPAGTELCVHVGDRVRGGETVVGWLPPAADERRTG